MPLLAYAKRRLGNQLHSAATVKEAEQTQLCAYLSIALLLGLGANALAVGGGPTRSPRLSSPRLRSRRGARAGAAKAAAMPADGMKRALLSSAPQQP
jgi:hypothetical protein